jgi:class 3 adenylate cyclase/tetratricopeptide (TPR) repeat protein
MSACPRCGERNPEAARFCAACGSPLAPAQEIPLEVRKTVTVLFCDVQGSTTLGEQQDPEQVRRVLSRYFEVARDVLQRHGGTVEKFMGDAVMAVFGVPTLHEDDALRALRSATELRDAIAELNEELERVYGVRIAVRIGVNSGEVIAGDTLRGHSFAAGDAVNVAQRLEAAADEGEILIGEMTYELARDAIRADPVGPLALKGREERVAAHRLLEVLRGAPSHKRRFDSPMIGRSRELQALSDAFERARAERSCHLFTVLGAAGVGKSRLVREALAEIGDQARVLVGTCLPYGDGITFWPVLEVVKQAAGIEDGDTAEQALGKIAATLGADDTGALAAQRVAALVGLEESGETAEQGFWGFRKLVEALARRQPTVLVFDDVNTGEPRFLDLVEHLAEWVRDAPLLVVCMARPELLDARPTWGGGKRNATSIFLEPLSTGESRELLANLLSADIGEDVLAKVQRSAEGNPLFVEEMVSMLIDGGYLSADGHVALERLPVPASIQVLLASRLDQLSGGERRVLERGAVEGAVFHSGAVEALADDELRGLAHDCLEALVRKELIRPYSASFAGVDGFRFRHVLIRDAAYESVPKQLRADLHERYAAWLEEVAGDRLPELEEVLGYHLEQAHRYRLEVLRADEHGDALARRAAGRLAAAGRRALAKGDAPAAVNLLDRAARLSNDPAILPDLGVALRDAGDFARAERVFAEAADAAQQAADEITALRVTVEGSHARLLRNPALADDVYEQLEAMLPELENVEDDRALAVAWTLIGLTHGVWRGRFAEGQQALERALGHARRSGDRRQEAEILRHLGVVATWGPVSVPEGIERCRAMLAAAGGDPFIEGGTLRFLAVLEARLGRFEEGRAAAERARSLFEELGVSGHLRTAHTLALADIEFLAGNHAQAERELREGLQWLDRIGERGHRSTFAAYLAQALYALDRLDDAAEVALEAEQSAAPGDIWTESRSQGTRAKVLARRGDPGAEALALRAVETLEPTDGFDLRGAARLNLAEVLELVGKVDEAGEAAQAALDIFEQEGNVVMEAQASALFERVRALTPAEGRGGRAS